MQELENVIQADQVRKRFKVYFDKGKSLKERVLFRGRNRYEEHWVLNGISFSVKKGEAVGLIGKNGCGKSTMLKMLTRIMYPTQGTITVKGRVSSLIELGAGFHPDMSGRENIYTNASIFGLSHSEIDRRLSEIIRFSELEESIDHPVRTYSSGMYMRLAFAVAISVDADVLLIDEILAVGDVSFQAKCFEKLKEIKAKGTTIVIVSHVMEQIKEICDRAYWLEEGRIREEGNPASVGKHYLASMEETRMQKLEQEFQLSKKQQETQRDQRKHKLPAFCRKEAVQKGTMDIRIVDAHLYNSKGTETLMFGTAEAAELVLTYESSPKAAGDSIDISVGITRDDGLYCFGTTALSGYEDTIAAQQSGTVRLRLSNCLQQGRYFLDLAVQDRDGVPYHYLYSALEMRVLHDDERQAGLVFMPRIWQVGDKQYEVQNGMAESKP